MMFFSIVISCYPFWNKCDHFPVQISVSVIYSVANGQHLCFLEVEEGVNKSSDCLIDIIGRSDNIRDHNNYWEM